MENPVKIDVIQLMALMNEMFVSGQTDLQLYIPYLKKPAFSLHLQPESRAGAFSVVSLSSRYKEYTRQISKLNCREIPDFSVMRHELLNKYLTIKR